ncbi:trypsin-like peptidase domain-containing protein [Oscillochloris sp. ZM17-4]|uniref:S1C family serine protease n=1 Tax=Oscillochloris sp. ZM17-4 TaxID=2866714 RepID=UPI001C72B776|nr:trypsin-like peptidase domain-containing protein [Oscillochloris sp. ZM17-4]MBX0329178.1 trypsin-like peptidase domain-containing protein [Oscillochloris sp. ZM17-4]
MHDPPAAPIGPWRQRIRELPARARGAAPFALGVIAALLAMILYGAIFPSPTPLTAREVSEAVAQTMASATPAPARASLVYQFIQPSLVLIQTQGEGDVGGLGTGVVIDDRGDILTSLHVVDGASAITVTFADGSESPAQVISAQPENDIAVLAAAQLPAQLVPATLGSPGAMRVGDEAYVVGHPLGLYGSMSAGVISGFDRSFTMPNSERRLEGLIQVDAAVNPGNSGGPLLNRDGQVIGIVAGLVNPTDQNVFIGIGFAVPITTAGGAAGLPQY